jgi:hypothetical protein
MTDLVTAPVVCDQADHISRANADALASAGRLMWTINVQKGITTALRALISEGTLTHYEALETYNTIADHNGWANIESISTTFTVEVCYNGDVVLTVYGVQADDDDSACNQVLENLEVDNTRLKFEVSYGDYADQAEVYVYEFDTDALSAVASEEE